MRFSKSRAAVLSAFLPMAVAIAACNQAPVAETPAAAPTPAPVAAPAGDPVKRGEILVTVGGCHDCHTPKKLTPTGPVPDLDRALSGHPQDIVVTAPNPVAKGSLWTTSTNDTLTAWSGAWGVSFAANLTPDKETGLGMTERNFVIALKTGSHLGTARPILPPMPWEWYSKLPDDELKAIYAYLQTIPAIKNQVPPPIPPAGK